MVVFPELMVAMYCLECGQVHNYSLSRFRLGKNNAYEFSCPCQGTSIKITTADFKKYVLSFPCCFCKDEHKYTYNGKDLWSGRLWQIKCPVLGVELLWIGSSDLVFKRLERFRLLKKSLNTTLDNALDEEYDLKNENYFFNTEIMSGILKYLYKIIQNNKLYCQCGNNSIEILVYPERVELQCQECGSVTIVYGENEDDLNVIKKVDEICLPEKGFDYLDSLARSLKNKNFRC